MNIVAFDVNGDSFLLEKSNKGKKINILIDGGFGNTLNKLLEVYLGKNKLDLDLLVCTHLDSDHANGLINLLKSKQLLGYCKESWLPILWADVIYKIIKKDSNYIKKILRVIISHSEKFTDEQEITEAVEINERIKNSNLINTIGNEELKFFSNFPINCLIQNIYETGDKELKWLMHSLNEDEMENFKKTLKNSQRLTKLVFELRERHIPILWLDLKEKSYDDWKKDNRLLIPLCHEVLVKYRRRYDDTSINCIIPQPPLEEINKRSIVLAAKEPNDELAIFSADSNFEHIESSDLDKLVKYHGQNGMLITLPHHGSHSSSDAILKLKNSAKTYLKEQNVKWVRGNSPSSFTLSPHVFNLWGSRYCLKCFKWNLSGKRKSNIPLMEKSLIVLETSVPIKGKKCICSIS